MIRAILFAAVGYWISRQVYERYDKANRLEREQDIERKLIAWLTAEGWTTEEIKEATDEILGNHAREN